MKKSHVLLVFTFLLLIPYICSLAIIGIGYNALVLHSAELYRTLIGSLVGAIIMFAVKATIQRPVDLLAVQTNDGLLKQLLRFFSIRRRYWLLAANIILDFVLCFAATYIIRALLTLDQIVGSSFGFVLLIFFFSPCLGVYVEYDNLSIDPEQHYYLLAFKYITWASFFVSMSRSQVIYGVSLSPKFSCTSIPLATTFLAKF